MKHDSKVYSLNYKKQYCCPSFCSNKKEIIWDLCRRQVETRLKRETDTLLPRWLCTLSVGSGKGNMSFLQNQQSVWVAAVLLLLCYAKTISFHLHRPRYNGCHARNSWTRICVWVLLSSFFAALNLVNFSPSTASISLIIRYTPCREVVNTN